MALLALIVVIYYTYLLGQAFVIIKQAKKDQNNNNMRYVGVLLRKLFPTIGFAFGMALVGVLYLVGANIAVMSYALMFINVFIAFVGDKWILSKDDVKKW